MIIDPLEAVIKFLENNLTIVGGRVAGKHRYGGGGWSEDQTGVSVHFDGGLPDIYAPIVEPRLEIRIYSDDQANVVRVWQMLITLSRSNTRFVVSTSNGNALVHTFLPDTNLSLLYDDVLLKDMGVAFFTSKISEEPVL